MNNVLLSKIVRRLPQNQSLNETIADVLNISYDAAHRRTSGKSKLSLEEAVKLSEVFNLSLDELKVSNQELVAVQKTATITSARELEHYFNQSADSVKHLAQQKDCRLYYSAKDIPIFYLLNGRDLTRFKIYVWLKLLASDWDAVHFEKFNLPLDTFKSAVKLGEVYQGIPKTEIWDTTTFNSTLKQIHFYYEAGQLESETALAICGELSELLDQLKSNARADNKYFSIYHNELLLMNNTVFIENADRKAFYVPFTFLSYFLATDEVTCRQAQNSINHQLSRSVLLNAAGDRVRNQFFDKIKKRILALESLIRAQDALDFE